MRVEQTVIEIPVDGNWNEAIAALAAAGWHILPGAKAILPIARTVDDEGRPIVGASPLASQPAAVGVEIDDKQVYILRDGKLLDPDGSEVPAEERERRASARMKKAV